MSSTTYNRDNGHEQVFAAAAGVSSKTIEINNAGNLSTAAKVDGKLVGIVTPSAWTAAGMTFQASDDGENFFDVYDQATERQIAAASIAVSGSRLLSLALSDWLCVKWLRVRSGSAAAPVSQGAARTISLILAN